MSLIKQKETEYWDMYNIRQQLVNQLTAMGVTASTSETVTSLINKVSSISLISTTINLSLSTSSIHYGGSVTATITLDDTSANALSNREVILYNGTTEVGRATTSDTGSATITFKADTVGSNSYTAKFLGKAQYKYSTSTAQTLTVAKADTVITLTASPTTVTSGSSTTLTVTLKDEWGNDLTGESVEILSGSTVLYNGIIDKTNKNYVISYTPTKTIVITATTTATSVYSSSTSSSVTITSYVYYDDCSTSKVINFGTVYPLHSGTNTATVSYVSSTDGYLLSKTSDGDCIIPLTPLNGLDNIKITVWMRQNSSNNQSRYGIGEYDASVSQTCLTSYSYNYSNSVEVSTWSSGNQVGRTQQSIGTIYNNWFKIEATFKGDNLTINVYNSSETLIATVTGSKSISNKKYGFYIGYYSGTTINVKNIKVENVN